MSEARGIRGPRYCVLEATLACNARCRHCGSSAGRPRERELDTAEMTGLVHDLGAIGTESVTLSGGEPLLRPDWPEIVKAIRDAGMRPELITNGLVVEEQAEAIAGAGFYGVTFSVDGPAAIHDRLRGVRGGLDRLLRGAALLEERGMRIGACTQINKENLPVLDELYALLAAARFDGWQLQLTMPMGEAAPLRDELCIDPAQLPEVERRLLAFQRDGSVYCYAADNIGYMSRAEPHLRSGTGRAHQAWIGCRAGIDVIGVTSDGTVRGCLSLQREFDEGNVRERPVAEIWRDPSAFAWNRGRPEKELKGRCRACPFGKVCRAGCTCLAFSSTGGTAENPYCLFALESTPNGAAIL